MAFNSSLLSVPSVADVVRRVGEQGTTHVDHEARQPPDLSRPLSSCMEVLTALVEHFTTSITELMGMERPFPPADLPKGDHQQRL
jgi:hypothetical protein